MSRTYSSFCLVAFFLGVTLLCYGPSVGAIRVVEKRKLPAAWCVAKTDLSPETLQGAIDNFCSKVDCSSIQPGGPCFDPNTLYDHASFAINMNYIRNLGGCPTDIAQEIFGDPSHGACKYPSTWDIGHL